MIQHSRAVKFNATIIALQKRMAAARQPDRRRGDFDEPSVADGFMRNFCRHLYNRAPAAGIGAIC